MSPAILGHDSVSSRRETLRIGVPRVPDVGPVNETSQEQLQLMSDWPMMAMKAKLTRANMGKIRTSSLNKTRLESLRYSAVSVLRTEGGISWVVPENVGTVRSAKLIVGRL